MGYKALVTIDLPDATEEQRKKFYSVLVEEKWSKITSLTTAWKVSFEDSVTRNGAINAIKGDLASAKRKSGVRKVEYALQLDTNNIVIDNL